MLFVLPRVDWVVVQVRKIKAGQLGDTRRLEDFVKLNARERFSIAKVDLLFMLKFQCSNQICVLDSLSIKVVDLTLLHPLDLFTDLLNYKLILVCIAFIRILTSILFYFSSLISLSIQFSLSVLIEFDQEPESTLQSLL